MSSDHEKEGKSTDTDSFSDAASGFFTQEAGPDVTQLSWTSVDNTHTQSRVYSCSR